MAQKRTKADKLQRNVERLEARDGARREPEIKENQSEPAHAISDLADLEERIRVAPTSSTKRAAAKIRS